MDMVAPLILVIWAIWSALCLVALYFLVKWFNHATNLTRAAWIIAGCTFALVIALNLRFNGFPIPLTWSPEE